MNFRIFSIEFYPYVNSEEWFLSIVNIQTDTYPETFLDTLVKKTQWDNLDLELWDAKNGEYAVVFRTQRLTAYFLTNYETLFNLSQSKELRDRYFHIVEGIFSE